MQKIFTKSLAKACVIGLLAMVINFSVKAQHYNFAASSGTFTAVSGTAVDAIETDDAISGNIPIGFSFNYFGTAYTELKASSNGFLTFNLTSSDQRSNAFNSFSTR